jgi:hypothetical protein
MVVGVAAAALAWAKPPSPSEEAFFRVVRLQARSLERCWTLAGATMGKRTLRLEVKPEGEVSQATFEPAVPAAVERCVEARVKSWRFPTFAGEPRKLDCALLSIESQ